MCRAPGWAEPGSTPCGGCSPLWGGPGPWLLCLLAPSWLSLKHLLPLTFPTSGRGEGPLASALGEPRIPPVATLSISSGAPGLFSALNSEPYLGGRISNVVLISSLILRLLRNLPFNPAKALSLSFSPCVMAMSPHNSREDPVGEAPWADAAASHLPECGSKIDPRGPTPLHPISSFVTCLYNCRGDTHTAELCHRQVRAPPEPSRSVQGSQDWPRGLPHAGPHCQPWTAAGNGEGSGGDARDTHRDLEELLVGWSPPFQKTLGGIRALFPPCLAVSPWACGPQTPPLRSWPREQL